MKCFLNWTANIAFAVLATVMAIAAAKYSSVILGYIIAWSALPLGALLNKKLEAAGIK